MTWQDLLQPTTESQVLPWLGGRKVHRDGRTWRATNPLPREFGWYLFELAGRVATLKGEADRPADFQDNKVTARGYLAGDRFIPEKARVDPDPDKLVDQTVPVFLVDRGLDLFIPVLVAFDEEHRAIFAMPLFEGGAEVAVRRAFVDRQDSVARVKDVTPALDLAFRFMSRQRLEVERRRAETERRRQEEALREQALRLIGTGHGRRLLAQTDFSAAAAAALRAGGAELIAVRPAFNHGEMIVQYRFENRRLECTCDRRTLNIIDAGVCLTDHRTGRKYDTEFNLETLPGVIRQAIREGRLVVWRHVEGDEPNEWEDD
jgi:hypothetical protein